MRDRRLLVLGGLAVAALIVGVRLLVGELAIPSTEIGAVRSPDGRAEAVLMEIQQDAHGQHSLRVCLRRPARGLLRRRSDRLHTSL